MYETIATNVSSLSGIALDWAVSRAENAGHWDNPGKFAERYRRGGFCRFSSNWSLGGEIIEREGISVEKVTEGWSGFKPDTERGLAEAFEFGDTALEAAMRAYVNAKLGEAVYLPCGI